MIALVLSFALAAEPVKAPSAVMMACALVNVDATSGEAVAEALVAELTARGLRTRHHRELLQISKLEVERRNRDCANGPCVVNTDLDPGVDVVLTCSLAKIGKSFHLQLRAVRASDAENLATGSFKAASLEELITQARAGGATLAKATTAGARRRPDAGVVAPADAGP